MKVPLNRARGNEFTMTTTVKREQTIKQERMSKAMHDESRSSQMEELEPEHVHVHVPWHKPRAPEPQHEEDVEMSDALAHAQGSYYCGLEDMTIFNRVCAPRYHTHMGRRCKIFLYGKEM